MTARLVVASVLLACVAGAAPHEPDERFRKMTYVSPSGETLPYRLFVPDTNTPDTRYPLVVFLHGGRGTGTDNVSQISETCYSGSHVWIRSEVQAQHPAFVLAPQLPPGERWGAPSSRELSTYGALAVELVQKLQREFPIDRDRTYLTGQSLGGWGTWDLIAKRPALFAAAIPVCGGGNPGTASTMKDMAIWAFHGEKDEQISVERSRAMVKALEAAGVDVRYTEYPSAGHAIWDQAYDEDGLTDWLFAQRRQR